MPSLAESPIQTGGSRRTFWILIGLALLLGAWIRLDQIGSQLPGDDEWHSLHTLRDHDLWWVFSHFGVCDYCIPMTFFEGLWMRSFGLDEIGMHFLPIVFGLAAIVVLPALSSKHLGNKPSVLLAFLIAIAPLHVFYSRFARPYAPMFFLGVCAVLCFERWWSTGSRRFRVAYVVCSVLAGWFQLSVLPFVFAPLAWALIDSFLRGRSSGSQSQPGRASLVWLGLSVSLGLAALLFAPLWYDFESLRSRSIGISNGLPGALEVFDRLRATPTAIPAFLFALALLLGVLALWRTQRRWFGFLLFTLACQFVGVCLLRPALLEIPLVMARYALPALFVLLTATAVGFAEIDRHARNEWRLIPRHLPSAVCVLALWRFGPLPQIHTRPNASTNHNACQGDYSPLAYYTYARVAMRLHEIPTIYSRLVKECPPEATFLEVPSYYASECMPYALFQRIHRHPIRIGFVTPPDETLPNGELPLGDGRFTFANFMHVAEQQQLRSRGIRYVIFHRQAPWALTDPQAVDLRHVESWIARYKADVGAPLFEDADVCVFDLGP